MKSAHKIILTLLSAVLCCACQASGGNDSATGTNTGVQALAGDAGATRAVAGFLGAGGTESINAVTAVKNGSYYVVGGVRNAQGPLVAGPEDSMDVFVAKFSQYGRKQDFMVTFGGSEKDFATSVAITPEGDVIIGGVTYSADFPVAGSSLTGPGGRSDGFVARFSAAGAMVASRYLGGGWTDVVEDVAVDTAGRVYAGGGSDSLDFPLGYNSKPENLGRSDAYVVILTPDLQDVVAVNVFGGELTDKVTGLVVAPDGYLLATGVTSSPVFAGKPVTEHPNTSPSSMDVFLARFQLADLGLEYASVAGGSRSDFAHAITVGGQGDVYIAGETFSDDFPVLSSRNKQLRGTRDGFILKASAADGTIVASLLVGGSGSDTISDVSVDNSGYLHLTGATNSTDMADKDGAAGVYHGGARDGFYAVIDLDKDSILSTRHIGGGLYDDANALAVDSNCAAVIVGRTGSSDFQTDADAAQSSYGGGTLDGFVIYEPNRYCDS